MEKTYLRFHFQVRRRPTESASGTMLAASWVSHGPGQVLVI